MILNILAFPLVVLIYFYKYVISPLTPASCRYYPSCSEYSVQAIKIHGPLRGSWMAIKRIARCHPWGPSGIDPVPKVVVKKMKIRQKAAKESLLKGPH